jgi:hypothetical protein
MPDEKARLVAKLKAARDRQRGDGKRGMIRQAT